MRFHMPAGESGAAFVVRDGSGAVALSVELQPESAFEELWPFLDRGVYRVEATGRSGRRFDARFAVENLERAGAAIDVRVQPVR